MQSKYLDASKSEQVECKVLVDAAFPARQIFSCLPFVFRFSRIAIVSSFALISSTRCGFALSVKQLVGFCEVE